MVVGHTIHLRVRYEETDTMQVVHYSKYLVYFEAGRIELLRSLGLVYRELERDGLLIPVVKAVADYHAPARFDDEIMVRTWISKVGTSSIRFDNEITRLPENELLCAGHTVHVLVDKGGKPIKVPQEIRKRLSRTK